MAQQTVNQSVRSPDLTEAFDLCEVAPAAVLHVFFVVVHAHGIHAICECGIRFLICLEE